MSIVSRVKKEAEKEKEKKEQSQGTTRRTTESAASVTQRVFNQAKKETGREYTIKVTREANKPKQSEHKTNSYLDAARNANTPTISTGASKISNEDKERRRNELKAELEELSQQADFNKKKQVGYLRGNVTNLLREAEAEGAEIKSRISQINDELKKIDLPDTISYNGQLSNELEAALERQKKASNAVARYSGEAGGRALASLPKDQREAMYKELNEANAAVEALKRQRDQIEYLNKYQDKEHEDNFFGQFGANYNLGRISQDANAAFSQYLSNPTEANKDYAFALQELEQAFQSNNEDALDDEGWVRKTAAGYLPQLADQVKYGAGGAAAGGVIGSAVGNPVTGIKTGITVASGIYSYNQMRGAAYRALISSGMDEASALEAAQDEAFISALIEMGDTAFTMLTLGGGTALNVLGNAAIKSGSKNMVVRGVAGAFGKSATDKAAKSAAAWAGKSLGQKALTVAGGVGLNAMQEYGEEWTQEMVSRANQGREGTGKRDLVRETAGLAKDALTGKNDEAFAAAHEAGMEGFKIGLMFGGTQTAVNTAITAYANAKTNEERKAVVKTVLEDKESLDALIQEGKETGSEAAKIAGEIEGKSLRDEAITEKDVERLIAANDVYIEAEVKKAAKEAARNAQDGASLAEGKDAAPVAKSIESEVSKATGYGQHGTNSFIGIVEATGADPGKVRMEFQSAYEAGRVGLSQQVARLDSDVRLEAYNAGRLDAIMDQGKAKDRAKNAVVRKDAGFDRANLPADVTETQYKAVDMLARATGVRVQIARGLKGNAEIRDDGTVLIAEDFQREVRGKKRSIVFYAVHEIGMHRLMQLAPEAGQAFINAVIRDANAGLAYGQTTVTEKRQAAYAAQNVHLTTGKAMEEVAADSIYDLYDDENLLISALDRVINGKDEKAKQGARKFKDILDDIVKKLKQAIAKLTGKEKAEAKQTLTEVEQLRDLFEKGLKAATEKAANDTGRAGKSDGKMDYSLKNQGLTKDETGAVIRYKEPGAYNLNARLRAGAELTDLQQDWVKALDSALKKLPKVKGTVYRTINFDDSFDAEAEYNDFLAEHQPGLPVAYDTYTSASTDPDGYPFDADTEYGVTMEIVSSNARDLEGFGNNFESEVLFARGTTYIVQRVTTDANGRPYIYMEEATEHGQRIYPEERSETMRVVQESHSVHADMQGVPGRDSDGSAGRKLGPQGGVSRGQRGSVRTQGPEQAGGGNAPQEQSRRLKGGDKVGVTYDAETESANPTMYSLKTWKKSEYVESRDKAAEDMAKVLGVNKKKALEYIDNVNGVAKMIADDRVRLDYEASPGRSSFVSNAEYGGSIDFSTICKKRRLYTGTFEAIQEALPNTALTAEEILDIRSMMNKKGYEVSCGLCYVEGSRANMGQYTKQFIERYKATNPAYVPNMAEMNTATGQEKIRREHPEVYEAYEYFMNHYGRLKPTDKALFASQQKPKMYQMATEYQDEILNKFRKRGNVEHKNANGGLRLQSFSDFEIIHLIDSMQVIMDMARVGLAGQAYTKVPDFAWALGDTGLKINLSLIAKGVDKKGNLILDEKEGMSAADAMALRDRYSENVGTIIVVFTDRQLKAAMADSRIDYIIPFHRSQWKTGQYESMGLPANTKDYTPWQNESYIEPVYNASGKKQRPDNYMPNTYWDFSKSGKENAEAYLKMCAENNRRPKFHYLLVDNKDGSYSLQPDGSTDGYWKTLIDFKMYDNEGKGVPQRPVRPDFNMEQAQRMLNEYTGGHSKFPAAKDVVDEFVEKYKKEAPEGTQFSLVEDEDTLDFLNDQEWVKVYRAMYQDETGLYPPMGAIQGGKKVAPVRFKTWYQADEHPELIKFEVPVRFLKGELNNKGKPRTSSRVMTAEEVETNRDVLYGSHKPDDTITLSSGNTLQFKDLLPKFELKKADGGTDVPAAYNPYFHTSLSALNDQFDTAYKRPGLVVVEGYIPKSELTSGYRAMYSKDPVGETTWKSGVVAKNLKGDKARKVFLSRWFRAERVVPDAEAAKMIAGVLEGEDLKVPWNVVTPALRNALETEGVEIDYDRVYSGTSFEDFQRESSEQFSLRENENLMRENAKLKEVNQELREQFKTTQFAKVDKKALRDFAKSLLKDYSSGADIDETRDALDGLYTYLANGEDGMTPSWNDAYKRAYETAVGILGASSVLDDEMYQTYKDLRQRLRSVGISIAPEYGSDLMGYEDLQDFRRRNFGRLNIVKNGTPVDFLYAELANAYPELFDEDTYNNQGDQLVHIADVLDSMQPIEVNPYSHNMRENATWLANDIMERFFELPQAKPTFADKAERKLTNQAIKDAKKLEKVRAQKNERIKQLIEDNREKVKNAVTGERIAGAREMQKIKKKYAEKEAKASENKKASVLRAKILRHTGNLKRDLFANSDKHHIPHDMRLAVEMLLDSINLESKYEYVYGKDGKYHRVEAGTELGAEPTKRTEAFRELRKLYRTMMETDAGDIVIDPDLMEVLERVIDLSDTPIVAMNSTQLAAVWDAVRIIEHSVRTAGKVLSKAKFERTTEWANAIEHDTKTRKSKKGKTSEKLRIDLENPYTFFSHYGEAGKAIFRMLRDAQDAQQLMVEQIAAEVKEIVNAKTVRKWEREVHEFTTERGEKLTLTSAQCMEIYELMKRKQAQEHLMKGGIVQPEVQSKKIKRGTDAILLTVKDLGNIAKVLTDEQVKVADALQRMTSTTLADFGNEASMKAYGYKKFNGTDYWPIKSAKEAIHSNVEKGGNNTRSIKNIGLAKSVIPHANNPLDIGGLFKTFASHAGDMTDYAAWLCPMEDANRLYNFQFRDDMGQQTGKTIKGLLDRVGGAGAQQYWHNLVEDIQNGIKPQNDTTIAGMISKLYGNTKGASVAWNIRVILQQPTAILRAAMVLSPADMTKGMAAGGGWKKALEYSAIAKRKAMGGFDISSPMQMSEILFDSKDGLQRFNEAGMLGAAKADELTWGRIWNACEWNVKRKQPNLKGEAFYEAVAKVFEEVIDQSQVVDGVLQRSQAMRSGNAWVNMATAFMGEPTMALNMLLRAYDAFANETDPKKRGKAIKTFGRATTVLLVTNIVNALAQSLADAARDDEDEEYWEKFLTAFTGITGEENSGKEVAANAILEGNLVGGINPVGYIPFLKDMLSIMSGYSVQRADAAVMEDVYQAGTAFFDSWAGDGKKTRGNATLNLFKQVSKVFGVGVGNLTRDVYAALRTAAIETGNIPAQYELEKWIYKNSSDGNSARFVDILFKAYETDKDVYEHIYNDLASVGIDAESIKNKMESRMKKAQGVTKVDDLEQRYLNPDQQPKWDRSMSSIRKSGLWGDASEKARDELEDKLYGVVTESKGSEELREKIAQGASYGLNETDYLLYTLALDMYDTPNKSGELGGAPTSEEKATAIAALGNLNNGEITYLWDTEQGYELYENGIDMQSYVDFVGAGGSVSAEKLIDIHSKGIEEETYFDFLDMLKEVDQPTESGKMGTYTQDEARAAVKAIPGLTRAERAALWQSVNKSWKAKNNPWR